MAGIKHSPYYEEIDDIHDDFGVSQKLGGSMSHQLVNARASSVAAAYHRLTHTSDFSSGVSRVSGESDPKESSNYQNKLEPDPDDSAHQNKLEPDPDDSFNYQNKLEPDPDDSIESRILESEPRFSRCILDQTQLSNEGVQPVLATNSRLLEASKVYGEPDPDDMGSSSNSKITDPNLFSQGMQNLDGNICRRMAAEPDPDDDLGETQNTSGRGNATGRNETDCLEADFQGEEPMQIEPDPDETSIHQVDLSNTMLVDEPDPDDQEIKRIQDSVSVVCNRLREAVAKLLAEVKSSESSAVFQTLFKIVR